MKIHVKIEKQYEEIEVHLYANAYSDEVERVMKRLKTPVTTTIDGYKEQEIYMLKIEDIYSVYAEGPKIFFQTEEEEFESKRKLYELEELLSEQFTRVNKSTLINTNKIASIQLGRFGTPTLVLDNEVTVAVSRNYLKPLKQKLGIGRNAR
ncbi:LytTR family DNA-binding domain-containing protein [Lysinibacillus odysseyi]|uniref:Response regulator n=1 Tax=Lysinibacillus odysseyi 34hs-1 = NBRC 100172 TaxID=1220589 RepID=A0A0A3JBE1_9BACI|nr:LytTR family DNA-binding domain-containing protein [Lysinibacillus odysseyi]KGR84327.1 response regulator [Lysinibacillus odysseyi 34hs-1 = NBRC 100172]